MRLRLALLASAAALIPTPAAADPATIGALVVAGINAFLGAGTLTASASLFGIAGLTVGTAIGTAVLAGGALAASVFLGGKPASTGSIDPGRAKQTFTGEESPVLRVVGRVRLGGLKAFGNTVDMDRWRLLLHAQSLSAREQYFLGGREVIVDDDGLVNSPPWAYSGGSYALLHEDNGDPDKAAWSPLMAAFPDLWTTAHRARGVAQTLIRYKSPGLTESKYTSLYGGGVPDLEVVARGEPVFDPRDPAQVADDAATWGWSDNGILVAYHVARALDNKLGAADFDWSTAVAEADRADVLVATRTGFEPRSRAWGVWSEETQRADTLRAVLDSVGAEQIMVGNRIAFRLIDDVPTAEVEISTDNVVEVTDTAGPESVERPNVCLVKYYSEERNFDLAEVDLTGVGWARIEAEIAASGVQQKTVELKFCPSAAQAQRIARRMFALERGNSGVCTTNFAGLAAWGARYGTIPTPDETSVLAYLGAAEVDDAAGQVKIAYTEWPALTPWNPATDEALPPDAIPDIAIDAALDTPAAPSRLVLVRLLNGTYQARIVYTSTYSAEAVVRSLAGRTRSKWVGMTLVTTTIGVAPDTTTLKWARVAGDFAGVDLLAKVRAFNGDDNSNWSTAVTMAAGTLPPALPPTISIVDTDADSTDDAIQISAPLDVAVVGVRIWKIDASGNATVTDVALSPGGTTLLPLPSLSEHGQYNVATIATTEGDGVVSTWATLVY